jgi:hypothetical protein
MHDWGREDEAGSTRDGRIDRDAPLPGVIDTIGFGYAALALRPLAILPVVALELYLLLGPKVALAPLSNGLADILRRRGSHWDDLAGEIGRLEGFNIFEVGSLEIPLLRTPGIVSTFSGDEVTKLRVGASWSSLPGGVVVLLLIASLIVGLLLAVAYRSLLARAALAATNQSISIGPRDLARRA